MEKQEAQKQLAHARLAAERAVQHAAQAAAIGGLEYSPPSDFPNALPQPFPKVGGSSSVL